MSSGSSAVRAALEDYVAGRVTADALAGAVTRAFYGAPGRAGRDALRPVLEVVERAAPGVVALAQAEAVPGFTLAPAERTFPREYEAELKRAAATALAALPAAARGGGMLDRLWAAVQRVFRR
jgi:hypothetical protein